MACPLCGQGQVTENTKAFGCSRWQEGCKFTIWKDCVTQIGGPAIDINLVKALLSAENGDLRGSTGILHYHHGYVSFTPKKEGYK